MGKFFLGFLLGSSAWTLIFCIVSLLAGLVILQALLSYGSDHGVSALGELFSLIFWAAVLLFCFPYAKKLFKATQTQSEAGVRKREGTSELSNEKFIAKFMSHALEELDEYGDLDLLFLESATVVENGHAQYVHKLVTPALVEYENETGQMFGFIAQCQIDHDAGVLIRSVRSKNGLDYEISKFQSASMKLLKGFVKNEIRKIVRSIEKTE